MLIFDIDFHACNIQYTYVHSLSFSSRYFLVKSFKSVFLKNELYMLLAS